MLLEKVRDHSLSFSPSLSREISLHESFQGRVACGSTSRKTCFACFSLRFAISFRQNHATVNPRSAQSSAMSPL